MRFMESVKFFFESLGRKPSPSTALQASRLKVKLAYPPVRRHDGADEILARNPLRDKPLKNVIPGKTLP